MFAYVDDIFVIVPAACASVVFDLRGLGTLPGLSLSLAPTAERRLRPPC